MEKGENKKVTFARKKERKKRGRNSRERKQLVQRSWGKHRFGPFRKRFESVCLDFSE